MSLYKAKQVSYIMRGKNCLMKQSISMHRLFCQELQAAKKEGSGLISRWADSFHNLSASYMMKNRGDEFSGMNDYVNAFGEKLSVLERISQRIVKEQYGNMLFDVRSGFL